MHANTMKDSGINKGLVQKFDTSKRGEKDAFYGFRKMFWTYLNKLGVPFHDPCCADAADEGTYPVRYNSNTGVIQYWNGSTWATVPAGPLNPTTTTSTSTTTTTTHG